MTCKHLWLLSKNEPQPGGYKMYGHCATCGCPGHSDLMPAGDLPVDGKLFDMLREARLPSAQ